jgi:hypothetical protein
MNRSVSHRQQQQLGAPDIAITSEYLFILAKLKFQLEHEPLAAYPERGEQEQAAWRENMQKQRKSSVPSMTLFTERRQRR